MELDSKTSLHLPYSSGLRPAARLHTGYSASETSYAAGQL